MVKMNKDKMTFTDYLDITREAVLSHQMLTKYEGVKQQQQW